METILELESSCEKSNSNRKIYKEVAQLYKLFAQNLTFIVF